MGVKLLVLDYSKDPPTIVTIDVPELTNLFNTLPNHKQLAIAIQEPNFEAIEIGDYFVLRQDIPTCPQGQHWDATQNKCVPDVVIPPPTTTGLIYDSHIDSKLHDGKVRTISQEGNIAGCGKGAECRASGSPKIVVNADGTFTLVTGSGTIDNLSLKIRSRHNEGGDGPNRFGGYGFAVSRTGWDAKREIYHNVHDQSSSGSHATISNGEWFKTEFSVKDESGKVHEIGLVNGVKCMDKYDSNPEAYMLDQASFAGRSYFWLRGNNSDNGRIYIYSCNYNSKLEVEAKFNPDNSITFKSVKLVAI